MTTATGTDVQVVKSARKDLKVHKDHRDRKATPARMVVTGPMEPTALTVRMALTAKTAKMEPTARTPSTPALGCLASWMSDWLTRSTRRSTCSTRTISTTVPARML